MSSGGWLYTETRSVELNIWRCSPTTLRGIVVSAFTKSRIKMKKVTFVNQKRHLVGTLFTIYKHFGDFVNCIFTILLQILNENKFYLPVNTDKPKFVGFFDICLYDCFIFRSNFVFRKRLETPRRHLGSGRKTANSQGYSELRKPIKKSENCYSLIW